MSLPPQSKPLCVSVDEFCRLASIRRTKAYSLMNSGDVESRLLGRRRLITLRSIEELLGTTYSPTLNSGEQ